MAKKKSKHRGFQKQKAGLCAYPGCNEPAGPPHHYIPWYFLGDSPFTMQLCDAHHKEANKLVVEKWHYTPQKFFKVTFAWWEKGLSNETRRKIANAKRRRISRKEKM